MLCFECKAITDIGNKRSVNQDSYAQMNDFVNDRYVGLYCVADGMGGLADGEFASSTAVNQTIEWYKQNTNVIAKKNTSEAKIKKMFKKLFYNINEQIYSYGKDNNVRVGTTYSMLLIVDNKYFVVHAGDSRIYLKRQNGLYLLTKDQTWVNEQLEKGFISAEEAMFHPRKNVLANCLGCFESPSVCMGNGDIEIGDSFLICSDGLYNLTTAAELSSSMSCKNIEFAAKELIRQVKDRGAYDNVTVIMVRALDANKEGEITLTM